jgi:flagellar biosynthesis protein FlhA
MTVTESLQRFTLLSIGDGLVSQIPALIVSMAAGMLVTRAASKNSLGQELGKQLLFYPRAMMILTGMLAVFAFVPGLPMLPFLVLAIISGFVARELKKRLPLTKATPLAQPPPKTAKRPSRGAAAAARQRG